MSHRAFVTLSNASTMKYLNQKLVRYTGEDAAQKFVEMLEADIRKINSIPEKK